MKSFNELSTEDLIDLIDKLHNEDRLSLREIAKMLNTYPVKISRFCNKHKINVLPKSEIIKEAYASNRIQHGMLGKQRSEEEKIKIAESQHKYWKNLDSETRDERCKKQSEIFQNRTDKEEFSRKGCRAIRRAVDEGSKFEKALMKWLDERGDSYYHHCDNLLPATQLEVDFYLPEYSLVIEIDGPSHFTANFGTDNYAAQVKADQKKNGLVLSLGASIIRLQHETALYDRNYRKVFALLDELIPALDNELKIIKVEEIG